MIWVGHEIQARIHALKVQKSHWTWTVVYVSAPCLNDIYAWAKFHENSSKGIGDMGQTRTRCPRTDEGYFFKKTNVPCLCVNKMFSHFCFVRLNFMVLSVLRISYFILVFDTILSFCYIIWFAKKIVLQRQLRSNMTNRHQAMVLVR